MAGIHYSGIGSTPAPTAAAAVYRQNCPNFNRDNFNFSLYRKKENLSRTSSIQDKRKHLFQLPQMIQMSSTRLHIPSQHFFLKLGNSFGLQRCVNARFFLSLCVLLIASNVTRKHWHRPQLEKMTGDDNGGVCIVFEIYSFIAICLT